MDLKCSAIFLPKQTMNNVLSWLCVLVHWPSEVPFRAEAREECVMEAHFGAVKACESTIRDGVS